MSLFYVCLNVSRIHNSSNIQAIINNDCRTFSLPSLAKDHFESVSPKLVQQTTKVAQSPLAKTTLKFLIRVLHFLFFFGIFSYLHGLHVYLFLWKVPTYLHCFLHNTYKKKSHLHPLIKTYTFINFWENLPPTWLMGPHAY